MSQICLNLLSFVGGPFDGFDESLDDFDELPACIALPVDAVAGEIFGMAMRHSTSSSVAVYRLERGHGFARYHFRGLHGQKLNQKALND